MPSITVAVEFAAAHRIAAFPGGCQPLHGHYYRVEASFEGALDEAGMVLEFDMTRGKIESWIKENWDHNVLLSESDRELGEKIASVTGQKIFYLPSQPTAENLCEYLLKTVCPALFPDQPRCHKIRIIETPVYAAEAVL